MLEDKKLFILDMDGTVYLGDRLFPETLPFLERITSSGKRYLFFTNNASRSPETYVHRLQSMGIPAGRREILTSGDVTIHFLKMHRPGQTVYIVGTPDLIESFQAEGILLDDEKPDIVLVSFDTTLTYDKLEKACRFIREGAEFLSTHPDFNCPVEGGFIPDSGSICALVTASTGKMPRYFGKPYPETLEMLMETTGCAKEDMVVIGDRLYTEIAMGVNNGVDAVLVLSGETTLEDVEASDVKPDYIVPSIGDLL